MTEIFEAVKNTAADLEAEPVLRFAELAASLLSWTLMASAYRGNYDGLYEYSNYTPLNFLLAIASFGGAFVVTGLPDDSVTDVALQTLIAVPLATLFPVLFGGLGLVSSKLA